MTQEEHPSTEGTDPDCNPGEDNRDVYWGCCRQGRKEMECAFLACVPDTNCVKNAGHNVGTQARIPALLTL